MTLADIAQICFVRQRKLFIAVLLFVVAAAAAITFTLPKVYEATATLGVGENRPVQGGGDVVQRDETLARSYGELLKTPATLEAATHALPFPLSRNELEQKVSSEVVSGTQLIQITASDGNPERAKTIANAYAAGFVRLQQLNVQRVGDASLRDLRRRMGVLVLRRQRLEGGTRPQARADLEQVSTELDGVRSSYRATQENVALQGTNVSIASPASAPDSPSKPRPKLYLAIGVALGLILATLAALLRNAFDTRVRSEDELLDVMDAPILSRIPTDDRRAETVGRVDESFQFLRSNLQLQDPTRRVKLIAVTSPSAGDGKTAVVTRLADAIGLTGDRVIAVDADVRKPSLAQSFGVQAPEGLTNILVANKDPNEVIVPTSHPNVRLLASGPTPPNPAVLLGTPQTRELMRTLAEDADYVLIDTPPVTIGADTSAITSIVDGVIVVFNAQDLRRDSLYATWEQLEAAHAHVLGIVLNWTTEPGGSDGYYGNTTGAGVASAGRDAARS